MSAREAVDALVMALDTPLLAGMGVIQRLRLHCVDSDSERWDGLSSGEHAALTIAAALEDVRLLVSRLDDRLGVLVADALTAIAEEAIR